MWTSVKSFIEMPTEAFKGWFKGLFTSSLMWIIDRSYWILLISSLVALLFYLVGSEKSKKYIGFTMLIYFLLQCIKVVIM